MGRAARQIDLNADLGEGFGVWRLGDDAGLLDIVTSANVACGFHAGDPRTMRRVCTLAAERDVSIGAHVAYRDLAGFGRRDLEVDPAELRDEITYQLAGLDGMARASGTRVRYVKAHGALYNRAVHEQTHAQAVVDGVRAYDPSLPILGLPGSVLLTLSAAAGMIAVTEGFPDRAYSADGSLVPRSSPHSVIHQVDEVARRAVRMGMDGEVVAADGEVVSVQVQSLCVHGDTPAAVAIAQRTSEALRSAGAVLAAFA